ncbi:MAG: heme biosynthesis protein HemY, partial [Mesorhizobium sp.]
LDAFEWRAPMERLGQLIDSRDEAPDAPVVAIEAPDRPEREKPVEVIEHAAPASAAPAGKQAEASEDHVRPVTAEAFAAVPEDAEAVEPAEELARLPDDPGVDPDEEAEKSPRRFRLF